MRTKQYPIKKKSSYHNLRLETRFCKGSEDVQSAKPTLPWDMVAGIEARHRASISLSRMGEMKAKRRQSLRQNCQEHKLVSNSRAVPLYSLLFNYLRTLASVYLKSPFLDIQSRIIFFICYLILKKERTQNVISMNFLDFKLSPCSLCGMFSFGYFPGV